jgi:predicted transcriptional regulator YdeE
MKNYIKNIFMNLETIKEENEEELERYDEKLIDEDINFVNSNFSYNKNEENNTTYTICCKYFCFFYYF